MNCPNCGKENLEGSRFCEGCGTPMTYDQTVAVTDQSQQQSQNQEYNSGQQAQQQTVGQQYQPQQMNNQPYGGYQQVQQQGTQQPYGQPYGQQQPYGAYQQPQNLQYDQNLAQPYNQKPPKSPKSFDLGKEATALFADVKSLDKKIFAKVISVMLAVLTIITMMMGWAKTEIEYNDDLEYKETYNIVQFKRTIGMQNGRLQEILDDFDDVPNKEKKEAAKIFVANLMLMVNVVVAFLAIIVLAAYIFLMVSGAKGGSLVGMLASILSIVSAIIFIVAMIVIGEKDLHMTLGLFLSIIAAVGNLVFMFLKKDEMKA